MKRKIFIICGASGSGKTAIKPYLQEMLRDNFYVDDLEKDEIPSNLKEFKQWQDWRTDAINSFYSLSQEQNKCCVICAAAFPYEIIRYTNHLGFDIHFGAIYCSDKVRKKRLKKRGWKRDMIEVNVGTNKKILGALYQEQRYCIVENSKRNIIETSYIFYKWIKDTLQGKEVKEINTNEKNRNST